MSEPTQEDLRQEHGFSKKVLINCCLVRRIVTWATPAPKGFELPGGDGAGCVATGGPAIMHVKETWSSLLSCNVVSLLCTWTKQPPPVKKLDHIGA
ncbi:unnamed protein product [Merluccius merluccius]